MMLLFGSILVINYASLVYVQNVFILFMQSSFVKCEIGFWWVSMLHILWDILRFSP